MTSTLKNAVCATGALAAVFSLPVPALAEESAVGADILVPKVAEVIPVLIAFVVIWAILARFIWPQVLQRMDERQQHIQADLDAAESARVKAERAAEASKERIAEAHITAGEIVSSAKRDAESERARILSKAQQEAAEAITRAHSAISTERHKAMVELSGSVADLSVEIAGRIIGTDLSTEDQLRLAERYLEEVSAPHDDEH